MHKELRSYIGAAAMFFLIIAVTVSLYFFEIPEKNNDVIKMIIGVLVGGLGPVMFTIMGKNSSELDELKEQNQQLIGENKALRERQLDLEKLVRHLQQQIIDKLSVIKKVDE